MTLAERFVAAFRLPYAVACILIGFVLVGIPNSILSWYLQTSDLRQAVLTAFSTNSLLQYSLIAYAFYAPHYMRTRLLDAARSLSAVLPDREEGFRRAFAGISSVRPQVVTWLLFLFALLVAVNAAALLGTGESTIIVNVGGSFSVVEFVGTIYDVIAIALSTLALSSVVWTYWSTSVGIHRLGSAPLQLRPYYEDAFLGLKPVGSLALTLATGYFSFIALLLLVLATSPTVPSVGDILGVGGFLFGLILLGVLLFFVPLNRLHRRMVTEKQIQKAGLAPKLRALFQESGEVDSDPNFSKVFRLDMMDRKISSMATWPFDIGILGRLSVIALSVTAILISRIIALIFHI
jgi:hypothetical protein